MKLRWFTFSSRSGVFILTPQDQIEDLVSTSACAKASVVCFCFSALAFQLDAFKSCMGSFSPDFSACPPQRLATPVQAYLYPRQDPRF